MTARRVWTLLFLTVALIIVLGALCSASTPAGFQRTLRSNAVPGGDVSACAALNNSTIERVWATTSGGAPIGSGPNQSVIDLGIEEIWAALCVNPTFVSLVELEGTSNFSLGVTYSLPNASVVPTFMVVWVTGNTTYQEYWYGNLTTDQFYGPFLSSHPLIYAAPPSASAGTPEGQWLLLTGLGATVVLVAVVAASLVIRRRKRGPGNLPEPDSPR